MPALVADIQRATRKARVVTLTDTAIQSAYTGARDAIDAPDPGFFETAANASTVLALKQTLIGVFRKRYTVEIADEVWIDPLTAVPTWHLTDTETGVDADVLLTRIEVDLETETTSVEVLG